MGGSFGRRNTAVTEIEFILGLARTLLPFRPAQAAEFTAKVLAMTADPHLRVLLKPTLSAFERGDFEAAGKWLERAARYHEIRRKSSENGRRA
jgi:hypothetical protein